MKHKSEAARGVIRIASNYLRLLLTFALGLFFARLALRLGNDAYGLIVLIGVGTGIMGMIDEIVNWSMVRELGAAYHDRDESQFRSVFSSAFVVCGGAALLTLISFSLLTLALNWLEIPADLLPAAKWFVLCNAVQAFVRILFAPARNMYMVSERMAAVNFWESMPRLMDLIAMSLTLLLAKPNPAAQVMFFGFLSSLFSITLQFFSTAMIFWIDRKLRLAPRLVSRKAMADLVRTGGWNMAVSLAMNLGNRTDAIIMNKFFGVNGNVIYGFGILTAGYARMVAQGVTIGIDAAATRISSLADASAIRSLMYYNTRLHGAVAFPAGLGCFFLVEPFLHVWIGGRLANPAIQIPQIVAITRILIIAITVRSISDGWTRTLYGAGHIRTYAPLVFIGSVFNPFLSVALLHAYPDWYTAPAWAHTSLWVVFHVLLLPWVLRHYLQIGLHDTIFPLVRPMIASLLCSPVLVWGCLNLRPGDLSGFVATVAAYAVCFVLVSWMLILNRSERQRVTNAAWRFLPSRFVSN